MTLERRLYSVKDFEFLNELGEGSYGIVKLAVEKETRLHYAVKILDQAQIVKEKKSDHAIRERDFLNTLRHPFILTLYSTFRDSLHLYYLLEYCPNGELKKHLKSVGSFSEDCAAFYAAEIFTALEFIHSKNVIHRDLKPENILLDKNMHIKLIDFATAKNIDPTTTPQQRKNSFCGTPEYVSPEVLGEKPLGTWSDIWSFGCLLFHILNGKPPFTANTQWDIFKNINERQFTFPNDFSSEARDLIDQLLVVDYENRLGSREGGHQEIKNHPFFKKRNLNWDSLHLMKPPEIRGRHDSRPIKKDTKPKSFDQITDSIWNRFLYPNEVIIYTGLVWKKKGLFSKKRQLILTNLPRLFYVDPVNFIQRGEVPWDETTFPEYKSHKLFHVVTPSRTYIFEDLNLEARIWVEKIKALTHRLTPQNLG